MYNSLPDVAIPSELLARPARCSAAAQELVKSRDSRPYLLSGTQSSARCKDSSVL